MVDDELGVEFGNEVELAFAEFGNVGEYEICWTEMRLSETV